jgi:chromosome segregation ATPase
MPGHIEHWKHQERAEAAQHAPRLEEAQIALHHKDTEIEALKTRLEAISIQLGDAALTVARKDDVIRQLNQSLGALSSTMAALCELQIAGKGDELEAEIKRLATNYLQIKALVPAKRVH